MEKLKPPILFLEQSQQGSRCRVTWHNVTAPRSCSFYSFRVFIFSWKFSAPIFLVDTSNSHPIYRKHCGIAPMVISLSSFTFKIPNLHHDLLHEGRGPPLSLAAMARGWTLVETSRGGRNYETKNQNKTTSKAKKMPQLMDTHWERDANVQKQKMDLQKLSMVGQNGAMGLLGYFPISHAAGSWKKKTRAPSTNTFDHETWWPFMAQLESCCCIPQKIQ